MKSPINSLRRISHDLRALLEREAAAIRARNYEKIASFGRHKENLLTACEKILAGGLGGANDEDLLRELETVRRLAGENAALLEGLKTGLSDARKRLEALIEEDRRAGLYADTGRALTARDGAPGALAREV